MSGAAFLIEDVTWNDTPATTTTSMLGSTSLVDGTVRYTTLKHDLP